MENISSIHNKWDERLDFVRNWLRFLKREVETPDLWQAILEEKQLSQIASARTLKEHTLFTPEEKMHCDLKFTEIKQRLTSIHNLQVEQVEILDEGFRYILESMERFGKKDWLNLAIGTLVNIAVAAAFSPEVAKDMFHSFTLAVRPLFSAALKLIS